MKRELSMSSIVGVAVLAAAGIVAHAQDASSAGNTATGPVKIVNTIATKPVTRPVSPPGVVALVNGKPITLAEAQELAFQMAGTQAVSQLIEYSVIDQEAKTEHVTATTADLDAKKDELRRRLKPLSLDDALKQRNMTVAMLDKGLTHVVLCEKLVARSVKPVPMRHVRHILILVAGDGTGQSPDVKLHTDAEALALIAKAQDELKAGKKFEDVAKELSEDETNKDTGGDLGVINGNSPLNPVVLKAALDLKTGETTRDPVKSSLGYHLVQCISTSDQHPTDEKLYDDAAKQYQQQQAEVQAPTYMQQLMMRSKVVNFLAVGGKITPAVRRP